MVSRNEEAIPGEEYTSATAGTESHDWGRLKDRTSDGKIMRLWEKRECQAYKMGCYTVAMGAFLHC